MKEEKAIINLNFQSKLSIKELYVLIENRKKELIQTEGLISLFCHSNEITNTVGGIYIFQNTQSAEQYLKGFLIKGVGLRYGIIPKTLKIDISSLNYTLQCNNFI
ncbi:YdhR family protein [Aquimarina muelleri]|nr:YdhR family protein [Aquimarina muelleri]MCX2764365.1 YdhR family protein [Aquimarina muelleri]